MANTFDLAIGPPAPVQICQLESEFSSVLEVYRSAQPKRILEIGTASGGSLFHWLRNATIGARIVTVDLAEPEYPSNRHLFQDWLLPDVALVEVTGSSHYPKIQERFRELGPFDWGFI